MVVCVCVCLFKWDSGVNLKTMLLACQNFEAEPSVSFPEAFTPIYSNHIVKHYLCTFL